MVLSALEENTSPPVTGAGQKILPPPAGGPRRWNPPPAAQPEASSASGCQVGARGSCGSRRRWKASSAHRRNKPPARRGRGGAAARQGCVFWPGLGSGSRITGAPGLKMCRGRACSLSALGPPLSLLWLLSVAPTAQTSVCRPPFEPENGGYTCHPSPCHQLSYGTVIEYFCDTGYVMKGDYKFLTCRHGDWDMPMQISCLPAADKDQNQVFGMNTLSIVATTASSVALILLLVVLFVLLQPKLKSFHHGRRDQEASGQPVSIMVEGVQVVLPTYEEAVSGGGGITLCSSVPQPHASSLDRQAADLTDQSWAEPPGISFQHQHSEVAVVHRVPSPSSSTSSSSLSSWGPVLGAMAAEGAAPQRRDCSSEQHDFPLQPSEMDASDDIPLLKEA
ncbi:sushi domain-containing protein 6-like [Denticeps clupeoides]|uniref:Sushi domain-containing protein n=1 Tax=Denticeps clupeoides TaxID=299321 RepID=A0AAY4BHN2_9TELE|nr:sushi domain-containing protein 6-like [Denticeps clupeoides]